MKRRRVLAAFLVLGFLPTTLLAAPAQSHSLEIESLERQYLAANDVRQRKHLVDELRALAKRHQAEDAGALSAAVAAMLPSAGSAREAEELLEIGAANPARQPASMSIPTSDKEFMVDARQAAELPQRASDIEVLADIRVEHLRKDALGHDGLTSTHVQQVWQIDSVQGARSFSSRSIMYSAMNEMLCVVRARVLKGDGRVVDAAVSADRPVMKRGASMYFDSRIRDLQFRKLEPGDVVEIEYYLLPTTEVNPWAGYYARLDQVRDSFPTRLWRRVVIAPSATKLYALERGVSPAVVRHNGAETTRIWEARDVAAHASAGAALENGTNGAFLHISTIGSLAEFGRWYSELLEPGLKLDEPLFKVAQQIREQSLTTQEKVQAVYESVQRSTRYMGFEFGVHSFQPYPVSTVQRRGFGDCKDKAAMMVSLLRAVGVPAQFAMVRTRSAGAAPEDAYSLEIFNHAMAYVPELDEYLDGTARATAAGELPLDDQGAMAMTVDAEGNATLRTVPFSASRANRQLRAEIDQRGDDNRVRRMPAESLQYASIPEVKTTEGLVQLVAP